MKTKTYLRLRDILRPVGWRRGFRVTYLSGEHDREVHSPRLLGNATRLASHRDPDTEIIVNPDVSFGQYRNAVLAAAHKNGCRVRISRGLLPHWMVRRITDKDIAWTDKYRQKRRNSERRTYRAYIAECKREVRESRSREKAQKKVMCRLLTDARALHLHFSGVGVEPLAEATRLFGDHSLWPDEFIYGSDWMEAHPEGLPIDAVTVYLDGSDVYFLLTAGDIDLNAYRTKLAGRFDQASDETSTPSTGPTITVEDNPVFTGTGRATRLGKRSLHSFGNTVLQREGPEGLTLWSDTEDHN